MFDSLENCKMTYCVVYAVCVKRGWVKGQMNIYATHFIFSDFLSEKSKIYTFIFVFETS